jgi:predicted phosphoadenosine phosphosulfate sulfurtransferase
MTELTFDRDNEVNPSLWIRQHPKGRVILSLVDRWDLYEVTLEDQEVKDLHEWLGKVLQQ